MVPSPNWLDALKLPARVVVGVFISCVALIELDQYKFISLVSFGDLIIPSIIVIGVISGSLSITSFVGFIMDKFESGKKQSQLDARQKLKDKEQKEKRAESEKIVLARIDHLDPRELRYLAECLRNNSQSFYTYVHSPYVSTLGSKGLIETPGGTHHQDHYPFIVNDVVWKALLERKDEILNKDAANIIK